MEAIQQQLAEFQNRVFALEGLTSAHGGRLTILEAGRERTLVEHERFHQDLIGVQTQVGRLSSDYQMMRTTRGAGTSEMTGKEVRARLDKMWA